MKRFVFRATTWLSLVVAPLACNSGSQTTHHRVEAIDAKQTLSYLASDELEGRGIGTAGLEKAADFIARDFRRIGLKKMPGMNSYFQPFSITTATDVGPKTALRSGDRAFTVREQFAPVSFSAEGDFAGEVVFAGYGMTNQKHSYDDYAGLDVKGKVVMAMRFDPHDAKGKSRFAEGKDWSDNAPLAAKAKAATEHGAAALLLVTPPQYHEPDMLMPFAHRLMGEYSKIPVIHIRQTVADELLKRGGAPDLKTLQTKIDQSTQPASFALAGVDVSGSVEIQRKKDVIKNVVAYLPGIKKDEYVVIGAHYDHLGHGGFGSLAPRQDAIHNGADDNASGTTALLDLATRLAAKEKPSRSIIFVAFTAEEQGLLGSARFVEHPPVPLSRITAMLNMDMVGRVEDESIYIGGSGTAEKFTSILKQADERSPLAIKDFGKGGLGPSDHMSFALKKIPVLFFFSGMHKDYHRPTDDADKINYAGLNQVIDLAEDVAQQIAALPRQAYVDASDAASMKMGGAGGGNRVTLGVVPDYTSFESKTGVRISGTTPGTPAAAAGLKEGDVIVKFDERAIDTLYDLSDALASGKAGQKVKLKIMRDKTPLEVEATLAERKSQ